MTKVKNIYNQKKGETWEVFFPSSDLENAHIKMQIKSQVENPNEDPLEEFTISVFENKITAKLSSAKTKKIERGLYYYDIEIRRPDSKWANGESISTEFNGIFQVV